jgi:hypothetical protein
MRETASTAAEPVHSNLYVNLFRRKPQRRSPLPLLLLLLLLHFSWLRGTLCFRFFSAPRPPPLAPRPSPCAPRPSPRAPRPSPRAPSPCTRPPHTRRRRRRRRRRRSRRSIPAEHKCIPQFGYDIHHLRGVCADQGICGTAALQEFGSGFPCPQHRRRRCRRRRAAAAAAPSHSSWRLTV